MDFLAGELILVDKPLEWTSFDVCNKLRGALKSVLRVKKIKVGHSGTLDPLATGLLVIATGKKTKALHDLTGLDKRYNGTIRLGATTASYDAELPEENICSVDHLSKEDILLKVKSFLGESLQLPPIYSAVKKDGVPAYKVARAKGEIKMEPRPIRIDRFDILSVNLPQVGFDCSCAKGTYIRSLAHDLGQELGVGGYLSSLRRTEIGDFSIDNAKTVEEWLEIFESLRK